MRIRDLSSDVCSSDLKCELIIAADLLIPAVGIFAYGADAVGQPRRSAQAILIIAIIFALIMAAEIGDRVARRIPGDAPRQLRRVIMGVPDILAPLDRKSTRLNSSH